MGVGARFTGKTVLVTGGAHGIGLATAHAFATEGAAVFLVDRDHERLPAATAAVAEHGGRTGSHTADVRSRAEIEAAVDACERELGRVDVLVNNAGYGRSRHTVDISEALWDELLDVNLTGAFRVAQVVARSMAAHEGGVILNASSSDAIAAEPGMGAYAAAKAAMLALTRAMAVELGPHRIRVCAVLPGETATHPWPNVELQRIYESRIAIGRSGRPDEIAAAYLYLASEDARALTGVAAVVDGGMLAWE